MAKCRSFTAWMCGRDGVLGARFRSICPARSAHRTGRWFSMSLCCETATLTTTVAVSRNKLHGEHP